MHHTGAATLDRAHKQSREGHSSLFVHRPQRACNDEGTALVRLREGCQNFCRQPLCPASGKPKFELRHVLSYKDNYIWPAIDNDRAAMPFERKDNEVIMGDTNEPKLYAEVAERHENFAPGSFEYWKNLIFSDNTSRTVTTTTENAPAKQEILMQERKERPMDIAKRQHVSHKSCKEAKEKQRMASGTFKNHILHESIFTAQQNAANVQ